MHRKCGRLALALVPRPHSVAGASAYRDPLTQQRSGFKKKREKSYKR